jgi:hypothetical protein
VARSDVATAPLRRELVALAEQFHELVKERDLNAASLVALRGNEVIAEMRRIERSNSVQIYVEDRDDFMRMIT